AAAVLAEAVVTPEPVGTLPRRAARESGRPAGRRAGEVRACEGRARRRPGATVDTRGEQRRGQAAQGKWEPVAHPHARLQGRDERLMRHRRTAALGRRAAATEAL